MKIDKIINNNIVSALDADGKEVIVMGRGLGFGMKAGREIPQAKMNILVREYRCSGGTDTANPAAGNR